MRPTSRDDFEIAIICALPLEADAVEAVFDEHYDRFGQYYGKQPGDANVYLNGRISEHNVVLCYMPGMGKGSAASVASTMQVSYTRVDLTLVVGICGGAPLPNDQVIYLGDVLISDSVIEYDFGRKYPGGFRRKSGVKDTLGRPNREIRTLLNGLRSKNARQEIQSQTQQRLRVLSEADERWHCPQIDDTLFAASYLHKHPESPPSRQCICTSGIAEDICEQALEMSCDDLQCDPSRVIRRRKTNSSTSPVSIHIGTIASADTVMKSGTHRDQIAKEESVIGFEMEGAGVWDNSSCIVIKGVCDYADSHKSKTWQAYAAATGACAAKAFLGLWRPKGKQATKSRHSMIPFLRNPRFVGRHNELRQVEDLICDPHGPHTIAITGLGGVGKTQVALELAYRVCDRDDECSIFWIPCTSYEAVEQALMSIAQMLEIEDVEPTNVKQRFKSYFSQCDRKWLLIFDNADDTEMWTQGSDSNPPLTDFIPSHARGHIIFTSRNRELAVDLASSNLVQIQELDEETGMKFLEKSLPTHLLPDSSTRIALLEQLTFLPLALSQATAYMTKKGITVADYLTILEEQEEEVVKLLSKDFGDDRRYKETQNPVAKTWLISFRQIQTLDPLAAEYLSLMACVDPRNIPRAFLSESDSKLKMMDALGVLDAYSFITTHPENKSITLHRLVHLATRNWIRKEGLLPNYVARAADRLSMAFSATYQKTQQSLRAFVPHALFLFADNEFRKVEGLDFMFQWSVGHCLVKDGKYNEALNVFLKLMELHRRAPEPSYSQTLGINHMVAHIYSTQGRRKESEEFFMQLKDDLTEIGRKLQPDDLGILEGVILIAQIYMAQSRWKEAVDLLQQALDIQQQVIGPGHLDTLDMMTHLAISYMMHRRWRESEDIFVKMIDMESRAVGPEHPSVLAKMSLLVVALTRQGRLEDAEELLIQIADALKRALGPDHPDSPINMRDLARILEDQGRSKAAEKIYIPTTGDKNKMLGLAHWDAHIAKGELSLIVKEQGQLREAEELFLQTLGALKKAPGSDHLKTLVSMSSFTEVFEAHGQVKAAEKLAILTLEAKVKALGPEHLDVLTAKSELASMLKEQGHLKEAEELFLQTVGALKKVLGTDHTQTLTAQGNLANVLGEQGQVKEAELLFVQTLDTLKRVLGPDHPKTFSARCSLAQIIQKQGRLKEAEELFVQTLDAGIKMQGPDDHNDLIASAKAELAWVLQKQGRLKEAEALLVQTVDAMKSLLVSDHPVTLACMESLATVLNEQGRVKEAGELFVHTVDAQLKTLGSHHPDTLDSMFSLAVIWKSAGNTQGAMALMKECADGRSGVLGPDHHSTVESFEMLQEWALESKDLSADQP